MKKMASNKTHLEKIFENEEFMRKLASLIKEEVSKSEHTDVTDDGNNSATDSRNNERFLENHAKQPYKKKKTPSSQSPWKDDFVEDIKSMLEDKKIKEKMAPYIGECVDLTDNSNVSFDETVETTQKNVKIINTIEDIGKFSMKEIAFPNDNALVIKTLDQPPIRVKTRGKQSLKQHEPTFHFADKQSSENIALDEKINSYVDNQGAGIVADNKRKKNLSNKHDAIIMVPVQESIINNEHISIENTNSINNAISLEQPTDINTQNDGENCDVSQSDDFYYLNMTNSCQMSELDVSDVPELKDVSSNILDISNINKSVVTIEPNITTPETKIKSLKPVTKGIEKVKLHGKIIKRPFILSKLKIANQISGKKLKSLCAGSTLSNTNYQNIIVVADNGVEKAVKIVQPNTQNLTYAFRSSIGSKPVIKSNERVKLQLIRSNHKLEGGIDDSIVSDKNIKNVDSMNSSNLPKIQSVTSFAEGLPRITSVTSCATTLTNIENAIVCAPSLNNEDIISLAERISPDLINSKEKILKIKRKFTKIKGKKNINKIVQPVENTDNKIKKNSDSFNITSTIDATIEEVIAKGVEVHDTHADVSAEKKNYEDITLRINTLNTTNSQRKGLKVIRPIKSKNDVNDSVESEIGHINFLTVESVDRSGLPSIQNVISLAENHASDKCLEEANQKRSNGNGIYTTNIAVDKDDDGFKIPTELLDNFDIDMNSGNDDFNFAVDSLIQDISRKKKIKKSPIKNNKFSSLISTRQIGSSNVRNKGLKVLKPVIRRKKRGKRKVIFGRRKVKIRNVKDSIENVEDSVKNCTNDVDVASINFADLSLIDTNSSFLQSKLDNASSSQSIPIKSDILQNNFSTMTSLEKYYENGTNGDANEEAELLDSHITEPSDNTKFVVENTSDFITEATDEHEELLEEVPLQQRRCNNFYVKVPTGEELGTDIDLAEYEKFFSIQNENSPRRRIQKTEIESLVNDEDLQGNSGKRRTKCSKCDKTFIHSANRKIHEATCENNDPQSSECSKCGRWFAKTAYRNTHEKNCQVAYGTIEVPVNDQLICAMCPFNTSHKTAYVNHLKSHMYSHKKTTTLSARTAALRKKFGYRRKKRKVRFGAIKNRCEVCNEEAGGVEHMVSRCRRCAAFNLQWCDECHQGGYSTVCRLRHHQAQCTATPHTRCNDVPRVRVKRIGPPLPLHCVSCDVTRILYIREKRCKQCLSQLLFKCEMCDELRDTFAELCGHIARAHIISLVQCDDCGKNCEDLISHRDVCESQRKDDDRAIITAHESYFTDGDDSDEEMPGLGSGNLILELDSDEYQEQRIEEV